MGSLHPFSSIFDFVLNFRQMTKWVQQQLSRYYPFVAGKVKNLHDSWRSGEVLVTLIYTFRPDVIPNFKELK